MEYTVDHGIHFHAVFYLNGHQHQNYFPTAQRITQHWQTITRGQGFVYDCGRDTTRYPRQGQGQLDHTQTSRFNSFLYAVSYLAKEEQKDGVYCCRVSRVEPPSGRGRPRQR